MNERWVWMPGRLAILVAALGLGVAGASAQAPRQAGTLVIAGQSEQAQLVRINGKTYVDVDSLARITHGSVQFQGSRTVLTLPSAGGAITAGDAAKAPRLSEGFLGAELEALRQIREWRVSLVNAIQNNNPVADNWVGLLQRSAQAKLQLALAATTTEMDQKAAELLRHEFANMQQMSDQFLEMHSKASYISPDVLVNNAQDQKIQGCDGALASMAATKQFQDDAACH